jgi:polyphosphate kinase
MAARLSVEAESYLAAFFEREILPVLTPITLDQGHPLPPPREESFHLAIRFRPKPGRRAHFGVVLVHSTLEPFVRVQEGKNETFFPLENVIARFLPELFPGTTIDECWVVRVNRLDVGKEEPYAKQYAA